MRPLPKRQNRPKRGELEWGGGMSFVRTFGEGGDGDLSAAVGGF